MDKLLVEKNKLVKEKYELLNSLKMVNDKIKNIDNHIINNCKHEWIREKESGPYGVTFYYCEICNCERL